MQNLDTLKATFERDGVVYLPQAVDEETLAEALACFEWSLANPTPSACTFYDTGETTFYQDLCHPAAARRYQSLISDKRCADIIAELWGANDVWFLYEQVFLKEGLATRRTPWHQDSPYLALDGTQLAVMWINFDHVARDQSLEFVRGSHRGTMYNGSAFDPDDDTAPIFEHGLPRLPAIESERDRWDIVSWAIEPGDIVVFHPNTLHGGAPTIDHQRRRTLSLRFFGADAVYAERPEPAPAPLVAGLHKQLRAGDPFRHVAFPQLRPSPLGFDAIPNVDGSHTQTLKSQIRTPDA